MKENWAYKKLGEVCSKITDGSHNPPKGVPNSNFIMISSQNVYNDHIEINDVRYLSEDDFNREDKRTRVRANDVLLTIVGTVGRCAVVSEEIGSITLQRSVAVLTPKPFVNSRYLMYCCIGHNDALNTNAHGIAQKGIYLKQLSELKIPIPPLETQSNIVSELDLLQSIIDKQKAQLKELDNLAQAVFYDMFGDPVENDKGWDVQQIGDVCLPKKEIKRATKQFDKDDVISYIDISAIDNSKNVITTPTSLQFGDAPSRAQQIVIKDDILVSLVRPNLNNVALVSMDSSNLVASSGFCVLRASRDVEPLFLFAIVKMKNFTDYLMQRVSGANYPAVREEDITGYKTIIPSLSLQQSFAEKIHAIEKQKANINKSIEETQKLFDYTMDKYFG